MDRTRFNPYKVKEPFSTKINEGLKGNSKKHLFLLFF